MPDAQPRPAAEPQTTNDISPAPQTPEAGTTPDGKSERVEVDNVSNNMPLVPGYVILGELGRGGMGVVFHARQVKLNREVALKMVIGDRIDAKELARFLVEAEAVASIHHPNVVQVYEYGEHDGRPFMALELLPGGTLTSHMKQVGKLAPRAIAKLIAKIARGVVAAHEEGVIHRDLKPHNVLFDDAGEPKVTDFGLAKKAVSDDLTRTGMIMGTPAFMAPEQASGNTKFVGPQADVWALGVILYEMLCGERPFRHHNLDVLLAMIRTDDPPTLRSRGSTAPRDLDVICRKCLEKNPAERYPTAAELADDLTRFANGEPIEARPAGVVERTYKWAKRKPTVAALYAAVLVAGLSVAVGGVVAKLWRDAEIDKQTAIDAKKDEAEARSEADRQKVEADHQRVEADRQRGIAEGKAGEARLSEGKAQDEAGKARLAESRAQRFDYAGAIDLAYREWEVGNIRGAWRLLDSVRESKFRGWEWHYVSRLFRVSSNILGSQTLLATSADGNRVVTQSFGDDAMVRITSLLTLEKVSLEKTPARRLAAFSPDGSRVAVANPTSGAVAVFDARTGKRLHQVKPEDKPNPGFGVRGIVFSPDGSRLAISRNDNTTLVCDAKTGEDVLQRIGLNPQYSPDGTRIATADPNKPVVDVWDAGTGATLFTLKGHDKRIACVCYDRKGRWIATASHDGTARMWDAKTGEALRTFVYGRVPVECVAFDPEGQWLAAIGTSLEIRVWSLTDGKTYELKGSHDAGIETPAFIAFVGNWRRLISGGFNSKTTFWEVPPGHSGASLQGIDWGTNRDSRSVGVDAEGHIVVGESLGLVRYDGRTGIPTALLIHNNKGERSTISPDATRAVSARVDGTGTLWNVATNVKIADLTNYPRECIRELFSPGGQRFAAVGGDGFVTIWDTATGKECSHFKAWEVMLMRTMFSPDGKTFVTSDLKSVALRCWDVATGKPISGPKGGNPSGGIPLALGPVGNQLIALGHIFAPEFTDWKTGEEFRSFPLSSNVQSVTFHPTEPRVVFGCGDGTVRIVDIESRREVLTLRAFSDDVASVAFTADGKRLVAISKQGTVLVWDGTAQPAKP